MGQNQSAPAAPADSLISNHGTAAATYNDDNFGQPMMPPQKKGGNETENNNVSKLMTDCRVQQRASLKCIEENYQNKNQACAEYFEAYKKCRRVEHQRKLDENAKRSGGGLFG
jgi:hypothetical protein